MSVPSVEPHQVGALVSQMHRLVFEEVGLWETLGESTVVSRDGTETHGPWPPAACSWVLLRWLDARLLGLYRREPVGETHDLSAAEAHAALMTAEAWAPSIGLFLFPTEAGEAMDLDEWMSVLSNRPSS